MKFRKPTQGVSYFLGGKAGHRHRDKTIRWHTLVRDVSYRRTAKDAVA